MNTIKDTNQDSKGKLAIMFPGAGSQEPIMLEQLKQISQNPYEKGNDTISDLGLNFKLEDILNDKQRKNLAQYANVITFVHSMTEYDYFKDILSKNNKKIDAVTGYSLGMYTALHSAGVMSYKDTINFLFNAGRAYQNDFKKGTFGMTMSMRLNYEQLTNRVDELCFQGFEIMLSNINAPQWYTIAGSIDAIETLELQALKGKGFQRLNMYVPSHTFFVSSTEKKNLNYLTGLFKDSKHVKVKVYSSKTGELITDNDYYGHMKNHLSSMVLWQKTIENMYDSGIRSFIAISPKQALTSWADSTLLNYTDKKDYVHGTLHAKLPRKSLLKKLSLL
jgi:[acyl-carrier-protein] S-malonyltransferase